MSLDLSTLIRANRTSPPPLGSQIPDGNLNAPRVANASLDARCEVLRYTKSRDEFGGACATWFQAGSYPCRVENELRGKEATAQGVGTESFAPYHVYLPRDAVVLASDRLGIPAWFNAWQKGQSYGVGDRAILPLHDGYVYRATFPVSDAISPDLSPHWTREGRADFLEVASVLGADSNSNLLYVICREVEQEAK